MGAAAPRHAPVDLLLGLFDPVAGRGPHGRSLGPRGDSGRSGRATAIHATASDSAGEHGAAPATTNPAQSAGGSPRPSVGAGPSLSAPGRCLTCCSRGSLRPRRRPRGRNYGLVLVPRVASRSRTRSTRATPWFAATVPQCAIRRCSINGCGAVGLRWSLEDGVTWVRVGHRRRAAVPLVHRTFRHRRQRRGVRGARAGGIVSPRAIGGRRSGLAPDAPVRCA